MPTLTRAFGLITALGLLWGVSIALILYAGSWGVYGVQWLYSEAQAWLAEQAWLQQHPIADAFPAVENALPDHVWALKWALIVMGGMTLLAFVMNALQPLRWQIAQALNIPVRNMHYLDKEDALHQRLRDIQSKIRTGKPVRIVVLNTDQPLALAMAAPFRGAVILSRGLIERLPPNAVDWIIAHELAHIRYRDMLTGTIWIASIRGLRWVHRVKIALIRSLYGILAHLRLTGVVLLLNALLSLVLLGLRAGQKVAIMWFLLIDRLASRSMEYRADRLAAQSLGSQPGIRALSELQGDAEPLFNGLFATHPKTSKRIRALESIRRS